MVEDLAKTMVLGALLEKLGPYELVDHWQQGEFHHDVVLRARGQIYVVATNCNGGVKEVLAFDDVPDRWALWHHRCPENPDFSGTLLPIRARAITEHWFDPCALLTGDARSEILPEHRARVPSSLAPLVRWGPACSGSRRSRRGGGWCAR